MNPQDLPPVSSAGPLPPQDQAAGTLPLHLTGISRKSGRRGEETMLLAMVPESIAEHATTGALHPPLPLTPIDSTVSGATAASASLSSVTSHVNWSNWGASLPPRGYTMSQRNLDEAPIGDSGQQSSEQASHHDRGEAMAGRVEVSATVPLSEADHRWKRPRTENVRFISLLKEVFMYLDTVASTQKQRPCHECVVGRAEEDTGGDAQQRAAGLFSTVTSCYSTAARVIPESVWARNNGSSYPRGAASAPLMPVDTAARDTMRVLQQCWEYCGAPHDAFEPVHLLSPITLHLLLTYGRHTITHDGQYVVLDGGAEQLPWVGCLYGILLAYIYRHRVATATTAGTGSDASGGGVAPALEGISRLLLLNCHSFGWLNHIGSNEYECSHRRLCQAREALLGLLEDPRYTALGRPAGCPLCASSKVGGDASTLVLLGDTIVMEGGVPSLGLARPRDTFTAHYQYGRGIACCVPEKGGGLQLSGTGAPVIAGRTVYTPTSGMGLCAVHLDPPRPAATQGRREWPPHSHQKHQDPEASLGGCQVEEDSPTFVRPGDHGRNGLWSAVHSSSSWLPSTGAAPSRLPAVCCGVCRAMGVVGQAVLLGPTGPLVIHLQFDAREWFDMSVRVVPSATTRGWLSAATADTTAVCPPPPSRPTSQCAADPTTAVTAALYAVLQGEGTVGLTAQHPHTSLGDHHSSSPHLGGSIPLAEFVEWLVRLLHTPPPALVVEWHSSTFLSATSASGTTHTCGEVTPSSSHGSGVAGGSQMSLSSPCSPTAQLHSPLGPSRSSAATSRTIDSCRATVSANSSFKGTRICGSDEGYTTASFSTDYQQPGGYQNRSFASHGATTTTAPLGMVAQPRHPTVMQLLETYSDVMQSRAAVSAFPVDTSSTPSVGGSRAPPSIHAHGTSGSIAESMKPHLLLNWLRAAQESLRPCEATSFFDGVERPLVLAKELEVAAEAERFLDASSVVTSLQFRPRPARV
ncbi:hypothetical protein GH5_06048 [Leishmania sp. Ghana 2012 LV757]|uniref:hypothetical protein n=1 Tax=Leishmania sp. Ghana 2012 LV757 TaxID=2803181 RepID=UPI001B52D696|nr:hypothetical protein GH5_06048 [Leishmania sp. Ghana 2012 LV757]